MNQIASHGKLSALARRRDVDEIVADVVRELGDATYKQLMLSEADTHDAVMSFVNVLAAVNRVYQREWSHEQRIAEARYAEKMDSLLAQLEAELKHPFATAFFGAPYAGRIVPDDATIADYHRVFIEELAQMREGCRVAMLFRPKRGRNSDRMKRSCAGSAFHLMQTFSRRPVAGSAESPFWVITQLLFEAVTGEKEANCKRACDYILHCRRR
jgi:hypothetical protein